MTPVNAVSRVPEFGHGCSSREDHPSDDGTNPTQSWLWELNAASADGTSVEDDTTST